MNRHQQRVKDVLTFFENKDLFLGFRRLLDCAMDTQNMTIYQQAIELTDWKEKHPNDKETLINRAIDLLENISKVNVNEPSTDNYVLHAKQITKKYGNHRFALGPISLTLRKREVFGLVGENGNGKTTLLRILAKELAATSGEINYGFSSPSYSDYDLKTKLAYIPQRTEKWYGSLMDNLRFVLSSYGEKPEEIELRVLMIVARLGLWNYKHLKWSELSSGYKMRFELARTLLRKPEILLLDEPLANLDILAQQIILEDLKSIANSVNNPIALILSSQQLYEVEKISDHVVFLKNGQYNEPEQNSEETKKSLILELDSNNTREELLEIFATLPLSKLTFNGGIYLLYFSPETTFTEVLLTLGQSKVSMTYIRDISASTRRFFIN